MIGWSVAKAPWAHNTIDHKQRNAIFSPPHTHSHFMCMSLSFDDSLMKISVHLLCYFMIEKKKWKTSTSTNCIVEKLGIEGGGRLACWILPIHNTFHFRMEFIFCSRNIQQTIKCCNIITIVMALYHNRKPDFQSYGQHHIITSV